MVVYKKAKIQDTEIISRMVADTSPEFYNYLLSESKVDLYDYSLAISKKTNISRYTFIAEVDGEVAGMCFSYNSKYHAINKEMREEFPENILNGLKECYENVIPDTLFLDSIYVDSKHRRKGIAGNLLDLTFEKGKDENLKGVSLFTLINNEKAVNLYKKTGFKIQNTFSLVPGVEAYLFFYRF